MIRATSRPSWSEFVLVAVLLALTACSYTADRRVAEGALEEATAPPFYDLPSPVPAGKPGDVVRTEKLQSAPPNTNAWRVLYHTTDVTGADIVVSGVVVGPDSPAPADGRVVVGWGHPTTGAAPKCAPSNGIDPFDLMEGLSDLLAAGYVVAAADYPGMGVDGPNSYLIGTSEGNSVLDAVRAARNITETGVTTDSDVLLWGHSQGGQAVLFAGQAAADYAPDLRMRGVAVAAPAADLGTLLDDHNADASGVTLGSYAYAAYQSVYSATVPGLSLDQILTPEGAAATPGMAELCLIGQGDELHAEADKLVGRYVAHDPATTDPWAQLLAENTPGATPLGVPLFAAQGGADTLVLPAATKHFVSTLCAAGEHVTLQQFPQSTHGTIAIDAMASVMSFLSGALAGTPPASTC